MKYIDASSEGSDHVSYGKILKNNACIDMESKTVQLFILCKMVHY